MVFPYLPLTFPSFSPGPSTNEPHQGRANGSRCCTASTTSRRSPGAAGACPTRPTAVPCARCRCSETRCGKGGIYGMYWGYNGVFVYIIIYMYMYVCMYKYIYIYMHYNAWCIYIYTHTDRCFNICLLPNVLVFFEFLLDNLGIWKTEAACVARRIASFGSAALPVNSWRFLKRCSMSQDVLPNYPPVSSGILR